MIYMVILFLYIVFPCVSVEFVGYNSCNGILVDDFCFFICLCVNSVLNAFFFLVKGTHGSPANEKQSNLLDSPRLDLDFEGLRYEVCFVHKP